MCNIRKILIFGTVLLAVIYPRTAVVAAGDSITECDRMAADPFDKLRQGEGVDLANIKVERTLTACRSAVQLYPDTPRFSYQLGRVLHKAGKVKEAVDYYLKAIKNGYSSTKMVISGFYHSADGTIPNAQEVANFLRLYAKQDDPHAQFELGRLNELSIGKSEDFSETFKWYRRAAAQGHAGAMLNMSLANDLALEGGKNPDEALEWLRRSAALGHPQAQYDLGRKYLLGEQVPRDLAKAKNG